MDAKNTGSLIAELRREKGWSQTEQTELVQLYGDFWQEDGNHREFVLEPSVLDVLKQAECSEPAEEREWAYPDWNMMVYHYDQAHLFCRTLGVLSCKEGRNFWSPNRYYEHTGTVTYGMEHFPVEGDIFSAS